MLKTEAVAPSTLELLRSLQGKGYMGGFNLVGGTALSLYWGHRTSIDIDLFSGFSFDTSALLENIQQDYQFQLFFTAENTLKGSIKGVKVDILAHRYPELNNPVEEDGMRLLSVPDIIAMKLNAVSTSGQRSKDFVDIYYALQKYEVSRLILFYKEKYGQENETHIIKSLIYFDEVDLSDWPRLLHDKKLTWLHVKKYIESRVLDYARE